MAVIAETSRPPPAWRKQLNAFWHWWSAEIMKLVPRGLGGLHGVVRAPIVALEGEELVVFETRGAGIAETSRIPLATLDPEGRRIALRNLASAAGLAEARVRLCLAREEALVRRVSLPLATEENLPQVLAFEMDRLSPFRAEEVYFDHRVAGRDALAGKVMVELGVARRELVDTRVAKLREWGATIDGVVLADDVGRNNPPLDLLPETQRALREGSRARTLQLSLAALVLFLLFVALVLPIWQKRDNAIQLIPLVDKARQDAEATSKLATNLERQVADHNFLLAKKHGAYPTLAFVEEISRLLPDSTWVQQLDLRTVGKIREVQIAGETPSSSKLIEIFEQASTLRNAAPRGTVTRGSQPNTERFLIAAEARPRPLPEPVPVASMPASPAPAPAPAAPAPGATQPGTAPVPATGATPAGASPTQSAPAPATPPQPEKPPAKLVPGK